uniref:T9SS type A sorting domain-containing protein n=2 Tax=Flavobacterium sp. TaxID=239 RepID=UPI004049D969
MKKLLLTAFVAFSLSMTGQVLQSENFNSYTVGNVGTDVTGVTPGQGDWFTFVSETGSDNVNNENFQFIANENGNALQVTASATASGTRFMWQNGFPANWETRTVGNDIIEVEFDYFTGGTTTSNNSFGVYIYSDEDPARVLAGVTIAKNLSITVNGTPTIFKNVMRGVYHWSQGTDATTGTYNISLGPTAAEPVTFPENTTVRIGFSFNKTSGRATWKTATVDNVFFEGQGANGPVTVGANPGEIDFLGIAGTGNTVGTSGVFDNFLVKASATDSLLSSENNFAATNFEIYPNPATDVINVNAGNLLINAVQITDLNGRIIKNITTETLTSVQVDIQDLNSGLYMMSVFTNEGVGTSKIVKK